MALFLLAALAMTPAAAPIAADPQRPPRAAPARKPDLAYAVEGIYEGDVISDARGGSQSGVTITVRRVGRNLVEVSSDYDRIPTTRIAITRAMTAIMQAGTNAVFLIDQAKDPAQLSLTIDDASLSVRRR